eukprot:COSAG03_NODE_7943_length_853_cov_4.143236_2_plen_130_part_00
MALLVVGAAGVDRLEVLERPPAAARRGGVAAVAFLRGACPPLRINGYEFTIVHILHTQCHTLYIYIYMTVISILLCGAGTEPVATEHAGGAALPVVPNPRAAVGARGTGFRQVAVGPGRDRRGDRLKDR